MFVVDQAAIPTKNAPGPEPAYQPVGEVVTASWTRDGRVYLLAARSQADLEKVVQRN
jgi:hypothetical protein